MMWYGRGFDRFDRFGGCFDYYPWGHWIVGGLLLIAAVVLVVVLVKRRKGTAKLESSKALEQLKIRYVNGEITEEQYNKMKSTLND